MPVGQELNSLLLSVVSLILGQRRLSVSENQSTSTAVPDQVFELPANGQVNEVQALLLCYTVRAVGMRSDLARLSLDPPITRNDVTYETWQKFIVGLYLDLLVQPRGRSVLDPMRGSPDRDLRCEVTDTGTGHGHVYLSWHSGIILQDFKSTFLTNARFTNGSVFWKQKLWEALSPRLFQALSLSTTRIQGQVDGKVTTDLSSSRNDSKSMEIGEPGSFATLLALCCLSCHIPLFLLLSNRDSLLAMAIEALQLSVVKSAGSAYAENRVGGRVSVTGAGRDVGVQLAATAVDILDVLLPH